MKNRNFREARREPERIGANHLVSQTEVGAETTTGCPVQHLGVRIGAVGQQRLHEVEVAADDRRVQRRVPSAGRIHISTPLQQIGGEGPVAAVSRHDQRVCPVSGPVVDTRSGVQQDPTRGDIAGPGCEEQRGRPAVRHPHPP